MVAAKSSNRQCRCAVSVGGHHVAYRLQQAPGAPAITGRQASHTSYTSWPRDMIISNRRATVPPLHLVMVVIDHDIRPVHLSSSAPGVCSSLPALLLLLLLVVGVVLQGLLSRPDWDEARLLPIAHIPGGSGNGLAHSCGMHDAATAALAVCKAVVSPMDVASVLQAPSSRRYMMLTATYGMMSNLDVDTEPLRWAGDVRFTLGALWVSWRGLPGGGGLGGPEGWRLGQPGQ
jgi:hypothetical protein